MFYPNKHIYSLYVCIQPYFKSYFEGKKPLSNFTQPSNLQNMEYLDSTILKLVFEKEIRTTNVFYSGKRMKFLIHLMGRKMLHRIARMILMETRRTKVSSNHEKNTTISTNILNNLKKQKFPTNIRLITPTTTLLSWARNVWPNGPQSTEKNKIELVLDLVIDIQITKILLCSPYCLSLKC